MKNKFTYPVEFNIRPDGSKKYFKCLIFETKKDMYALYIKYAELSGWKKKSGIQSTAKYGLSKVNTYDDKPKFAAIVIPFESFFIDKNKKEIINNRIGIMLFHKGRLGAGLVSHEFGHAAFHHQRIKLGFMKDELNLGKHNCELEEECLYDLASMVRKFTNKCYKIGIYK